MIFKGHFQQKSVVPFLFGGLFGSTPSRVFSDYSQTPQGGPLQVINRVITPINGLING